MSLSYNYPLFDNLPDKNSGIALTMPDAEVRFYPGFFAPVESDRFFQNLMDNIDWQQSSINTPRGRVPFPRLVAWYGDANALYSYSGVTYKPAPWTPALLSIKTRIEAVAQVEFNSVLLNLYRDGNDSVSWHSDDEPELGSNPVIGSVSFGSTRSFQFKHMEQPGLRAAVELTHGSFLLMAGSTQHFWKHQIPKTRQAFGPRINLTFRVITNSPKSR